MSRRHDVKKQRFSAKFFVQRRKRLLDRKFVVEKRPRRKKKNKRKRLRLPVSHNGSEFTKTFPAETTRTRKLIQVYGGNEIARERASARAAASVSFHIRRREWPPGGCGDCRRKRGRGKRAVNFH